MSARGRLLAMAALAVVAMVVEAPAALLASPIEAWCDGRCRLAGIEGRLWQGGADLWLRQGQARSGQRNWHDWQDWQAAGRLRWRLDGSALGRGRLALVIGQGAVASEAARIEAGLGGIAVTVDRLAAPAGPLLASLGEGMPTSGWGGHLLAENCTLRLDWTGNWQGEGVLRWLDARTSLLESLALGDYRLAWRKPPDGAGSGDLSTERGDLALQGALTVGERGPRFAGTAEAREAGRGRLEKYLRAVGTPVAGVPGKYQLHLPGAPGE